jgi:signal transduction histidine kinase
MKREFTISISNRLTLTYVLFTSLALGILTIIVNIFIGITFISLVKDNIAQKSGEIVKAIERQYNPMIRGFDIVTVEAVAMNFVHEGYIVTLEDGQGNTVWDARSCDMQKCMDVINSITERMEGRFRMNGAMQIQDFPVTHANRTVGKVIIETYGPFFYSKLEGRFLTSVNRLLFVATAVITLFGIAISLALSRSIVRPILKAEEAARKIARAYSGGVKVESPVIRIDDRYKTKELASLSRSINELAVELEEGERRQKQLTADIAHELRTPLTCLQGNIEAMIDGVYKADREHLENCHEEIVRLTNLVQDVNTLTNLEWKNIALNKSEFDLSKLLQTVAEQFNNAVTEKGIALNLNLKECSIIADYSRLKQVFINLLSNAVKYTDFGNITISIKEDAESRTTPSRWEISIADTGIGIPEEDLSRVFERFYRSDKSRSRNTGGLGLGLTIAAAVVAAHGGTIEVVSNSTCGSVFRVRL